MFDTDYNMNLTMQGALEEQELLLQESRLCILKGMNP
jgi:hypothetical protein